MQLFINGKKCNLSYRVTGGNLCEIIYTKDNVNLGDKGFVTDGENKRECFVWKQELVEFTENVGITDIVKCSFIKLI